MSKTWLQCIGMLAFVSTGTVMGGTGAHSGQKASSRLEAPPADAVSLLGERFYPDDLPAQKNLRRILQAIQLHRVRPPFRGGVAPDLGTFDLHSMPLAVVVSTNGNTADLLLLNWSDAPVTGSEEVPELTALLGSPAYVLRSLPQAGIPNGGQERWGDEFWGRVRGNYSELPADRLPGHLPVNHPLRKALGLRDLPVIAPASFDLRFESPLAKPLATLFPAIGFFQRVSNTAASFIPAQRQRMAELLASSEARAVQRLTVSVHESYHLNEANQRRTLNRPMPFTDREKALRDLNDPKTGAARLMAGYGLAVFELNKALASGASIEQLTQRMGYVRALISEMRKVSPEFWKYFSEIEKLEGLADFSAQQTMIDLKLRTFDEILEEYQTTDPNSLPYRTGSLAQLFLEKRGKRSTWAGDASDETTSLWEHALDKFDGQIAIPTSEALERYLSAIPSELVVREMKRLRKYPSVGDGEADDKP